MPDLPLTRRQFGPFAASNLEALLLIPGEGAFYAPLLPIPIVPETASSADGPRHCRVLLRIYAWLVTRDMRNCYAQHARPSGSAGQDAGVVRGPASLERPSTSDCASASTMVRAHESSSWTWPGADVARALPHHTTHNMWWHSGLALAIHPHQQTSV
jgi:hypothetical protein